MENNQTNSAKNWRTTFDMIKANSGDYDPIKKHLKIYLRNEKGMIHNELARKLGIDLNLSEQTIVERLQNITVSTMTMKDSEGNLCVLKKEVIWKLALAGGK